MTKLLFIPIIIFTIAFCFTTVNAQNKLNSNSISGFVYDKTNGEALIGANVYLKSINRGSTTNSIGYFVIPDLPTGTYSLVCSYLGYQTIEIEVEIKRSGTPKLTIELNPAVIETGEVLITDRKGNVIENMFAKPVSNIELSQQQINQIPRVIEADLLRSLQTLPGVTSLSDFSSALYIRGGTPDQNLYLVDGADVYNPEHAFGIFSTFNTNAIKKVTLSKGGFGAEYGGRLSSVLDIVNLDGNRNEFEGVFNLSLLSASTTMQMPLGSLGSISGSFRRTYIDQTYAKWIDEVPEYYFYDGNIKAYLDLDERNKLSISFYNGRDDLDFKLDKDAPESISFIYNWSNTTGSVNWKHIFNTKLFSSFWFTASRFKSNFEFDDIFLTEENLISDYTLKASLEYYLLKNLNLKFGAEHKLLHEYYNQDHTDQLIHIDNHRRLSMAYLSADWQPMPELQVEAGFRSSYFDADTNFFNIDPRFSIKYRLTEESNLKFAAGVYHQYLNRLNRMFITSIWATANKYNNDSRAIHYILGYQRELGNIWEFEVETYYKKYNNLYQYNYWVGTDIEPGYFDEQGRPVYTSTENVFNRGDGESFGIEFLVRKNIGVFTGWISYSLAKSNYKFNNLNNYNYFVPRHNRTSVVNAVANINLDELMSGKRSDTRFVLGLNFVYGSGQPITVPSSAYFTHDVPDWNDLNNPHGSNSSYKLYPGEMNAFELPAYSRLDLSLTYEKDYGSWQLAPYLQIINLGARKNLWFIQYEDELEDGRIVQKIEKVNMLPLLPSLGVTIKF